MVSKTGVKTGYLIDLGEAERKTVVSFFLIPVILWESEPLCRWVIPSPEVSSGEERGAASTG